MQNRRGFTLFDLAGILVSGTCLTCIAAAMFGSQPEAPRDTSQRLKDATQIRGIHQSFVVWAQSNGDTYPLPSKIDTQDNTVNDRGTLKDNTANIYSMLVYIGAISTEILISPVEKNPNIVLFDRYEFDAPRMAAKPAMALWDPALSVDFTDGHKGAASYAHLQPSGGRLKRWTANHKANEMIISNRGPEIARVQKNEDGSVTPTLADPKSLTLTFFEEDLAWSCNVSYNDNHVDFRKRIIVPGKSIATDPKSPTPTYTDADGKVWPDLWTCDEPDDEKSVNDLLGIFTRGGSKPSEFKSIWD